MTLTMEHALQEIDGVRGWRVMIMLPPEAANAEGILAVLPWIEDGKPRPGTTLHLFEVKNGLALITGGVLTEREGAILFEIHDQLKGVATRMFVVPPASAPSPLFARMYEAGAAPLLPVAEDLPSSRFWSVMCIAALTAVMFWIIMEAMGSSGARATQPLIYSLSKLVLFWGAVGCGIKSWFQKRKLRGVLEDPVRMTIMQWTPSLPPFVARR
jgi:hypothetical protein